MSLRALALVKNIFQDSFIPKIMSLAFLSQKFTQDLQVNPYEHVKEFNDFKFYCFPFKPEKKTQMTIYTFLNRFSIHKQVAQRARIAHLSPMYQGKMWSFQHREKMETSFSHYKSMGAFCCHGNQSFDPICLKTLRSLSPTPMMLHIKFDQDWPTGFRDIQVQKFEIFVTQGQVTPKWVVWFGPKSNSTELLCLCWLPATLMMIWWKMNELAWRQHFPIISLWEIF